MVNIGNDELNIHNLLASRVQQAKASSILDVVGSSQDLQVVLDDQPPQVLDQRVKENKKDQRKKGIDGHQEGNMKSLRKSTLNHPSSSLANLSSLDFLTLKVDTDNLIMQELISVKGRDYLKRVDSSTKWKIYCEFQARSIALAHNLVLEHTLEATELNRKLKESEKLMVEALAINKQLTELNNKYVAELDRLHRQVDDLILRNQVFEEEKRKGTKDVDLMAYKEYTKQKMVAQHEDNVNQAVLQAKYFFDLREHEFDLGKDFYHEVFLPFYEMPEDVELEEDVPMHLETPLHEDNMTPIKVEGNKKTFVGHTQGNNADRGAIQC